MSGAVSIATRILREKLGDEQDVASLSLPAILTLISDGLDRIDEVDAREDTIWDLSLDPSEKLTLLAISRIASIEGKVIIPHAGWLAKRTGLTTDQQVDVLYRLINAGLISGQFVVQGVIG